MAVRSYCENRISEIRFTMQIIPHGDEPLKYCAYRSETNSANERTSKILWLQFRIQLSKGSFSSYFSVKHTSTLIKVMNRKKNCRLKENAKDCGVSKSLLKKEQEGQGSTYDNLPPSTE
jgi:hypothetical protein